MPTFEFTYLKPVTQVVQADSVADMDRKARQFQRELDKLGEYIIILKVIKKKDEIDVQEDTA